MTRTTTSNRGGASIRCCVSPNGKARIDALEQQKGEPLRANPSGLCTADRTVLRARLRDTGGQIA